MVLVQKQPLFQLFFQAILARKMSFMIFQNKKTLFKAIKIRSFKRRKVDIFPKGLPHGFGTKNGHFWNFFFQAMQGRKMSFILFWNEKNAFLSYETRSSKSPKIDIFPKGLPLGFGPKMAIFARFFLGNVGQENVFYIILERKNAFLSYENKNFKKSKN